MRPDALFFYIQTKPDMFILCMLNDGDGNLIIPSVKEDEKWNAIDLCIQFNKAEIYRHLPAYGYTFDQFIEYFGNWLEI